MTLPAELITRLRQQSIVSAAMRSMADHTATTLDSISIDRIVLIQKWSGLFTVAITARTGEIKVDIIIQPLDEAMTAQTGEVALLNGMIG